jgi:hypothetical protein
MSICTDKADYKIETCQIQHFLPQFGKVTSNEPIKTAEKKPGFLNLD